MLVRVGGAAQSSRDSAGQASEPAPPCPTTLPSQGPRQLPVRDVPEKVPGGSEAFSLRSPISTAHVEGMADVDAQLARCGLRRDAGGPGYTQGGRAGRV